MRFVNSLPGAIALAILFVTVFGGPAQAGRSQVRDLTIHAGDVPRRLVGYGLVIGLDGTGDRTFGGYASQNATVHSIVNLLKRFDIEVPPQYLRVRNVAAVLVTAETSPYLRAGGRFDVTVSAMGDARSLEGGTLWMTPLITNPNQPPVATAQGPMLVTTESQDSSPWRRRSNSGRLPDGGVLEVDPPPVVGEPKLLLRTPDWAVATQIAQAIDATFGVGTASVEDPGSVTLAIPANAGAFMAGVDTIQVSVDEPAKVVIHGRDGTVVAGGTVLVGTAVISHQGLTLQIGGTLGGPALTGLVQVPEAALVQDVAAGLHAAGADAREIAAIFEALRDVGALNAELVIR